MRSLTLFLALLSCAALASDRSPDLPGEVMPDRRWDFVSLSLDLRVLPADRAVEGSATHVVRPVGRPDPWLRMHAVDLDIREITVDGKVVEGWRAGRDTLDIPIGVADGERTVVVRYRATPEGGLYFRGGKGSGDAIAEVWSQGEDIENRHWFPGWDYPNDRFVVRQAYTVPAGWVAVGNGAEVGRTPQPDGSVRWEFRLEQEITGYLVALAAGEYRVVEDRAGPVPLQHVVARGVDDDTVRRTTEPTADVLAYLAELLDEPYPYPVYRQVFVQRFLYGGMENASSTIMADGYLLETEHEQRWWGDVVVAHEAAHQWFGDLVGCYGWRELWLNEGFAQYYETRWLEHGRGTDAAARAVEGWMDNGNRDGAPMAARGWSKVGERSHAQVYVRGAATLHMLEILLGRDVFDAGIRRYVQDNKGRQAETEDLRRALEEVSGEHLGWLFDRYVYAAEFPAVKARSSWTAGELVVTLTSTKGPLAAGPVDVEVGTPNGPRRQRAWLDAADVRIVIPLAEPPRYVAIDPDRGLLVDWDLAQEPAEWIAQLGSDAILARRTAIAELGAGKAAPGVVEALSAILASPSEAPQTRAAAAAALGKLGGAEALPALDAAFGADDGMVRQAAADAVGKLVAQPATLALARRGLADPDPDVRDTALRALAALDPDAGLAEARRRLRGLSTQGSIHAAAAGVLGEHGEPSDLPELVRRIGYADARDTRHAAARAAASLLEGDDADKHRQAATAALVRMLGDADRLDTGLAIGLLGRVGDETALAPLREYASHTSMRSPDLGRLALDAASAIRSRGKAPPAGAEAQADADRVKAELEALEERIERLEEWR